MTTYELFISIYRYGNKAKAPPGCAEHRQRLHQTTDPELFLQAHPRKRPGLRTESPTVPKRTGDGRKGQLSYSQKNRDKKPVVSYGVNPPLHFTGGEPAAAHLSPNRKLPVPRQEGGEAGNTGNAACFGRFWPVFKAETRTMELKPTSRTSSEIPGKKTVSNGCGAATDPLLMLPQHPGNPPQHPGNPHPSKEAIQKHNPIHGVTCSRAARPPRSAGGGIQEPRPTRRKVCVTGVTAQALTLLVLPRAWCPPKR